MLLCYPPFGFSVWYDRHHGKGWCWRERHPKGPDDDVTEGSGFASKSKACDGARAELRRRGARDSEAGEDAGEPGVDSP
jgi:hypothetical protein